MTTMSFFMARKIFFDRFLHLYWLAYLALRSLLFHQDSRIAKSASANFRVNINLHSKNRKKKVSGTI